ncbi:ATP-dependent protease ATPase subunit HslU, partial [Desulfovibrio sp.]
MSTLTPREIVAELDKFVVGQEQAKRMVAVAVRNRWRRQHLPEELRDEVAPKNIIMMGPTGVGKTEIARRLAKLSGAPFIKVEATKFTEVGYVGRDVESMVRDLMEIGINLVREEENARVRAAAEAAAESRLLDLLLPNSFGGDRNDTREKLRQQFRLGFMDDREVEVEVTEQPAQGMDMFAIPGMEQMGNQVRDMFSKAFPPRRNRRKMKVREAYNVLIQEESGKLVDQEALVDKARERVEQMGIIFIDEIDKIASSSQNRTSDISREGVQRDLLPIVEGSAVNTKYG